MQEGLGIAAPGSVWSVLVSLVGGRLVSTQVGNTLLSSQEASQGRSGSFSGFAPARRVRCLLIRLSPHWPDGAVQPHGPVPLQRGEVAVTCRPLCSAHVLSAPHRG